MARINLSEYIKSKRDGRQTHIELSDGTVLKVDPLELWSDEVLDYATTDQVRAAKALLGGEGNYARFVADGGGAALLLTIMQEKQEVSTGEAGPSPS